MNWVLAVFALLALIVAFAALREARRVRTELDGMPVPVPPEPPRPASAPLEDEALQRVLATEQAARTALARRMADLEGRVGEYETQAAALEDRLQSLVAPAALDRPPEPQPEPRRSEAPPAAPEPPASERVRRALAAQGYGRATLLPRDEDGRRYTVEAERNGVTVKGVAKVRSDGSVDLALRPALRAFP